MSSLDAIVAQRRHDLKSEKTFVPVEALQAMVAERGPRRSFAASLSSAAPAIVAEIKRASPSAKVIDADCEPAAVAVAYERGGAAALSVLTEPRFFRGSFADLCNARAAVRLPVLCKDFILDDFQVWKAAAFGVDAILLIAAILDDECLSELLRLTSGLGLDALVEVHTEQETARALSAGARIIGINNRDLKTFAVDRSVATRLRTGIPADRIVVAESGYAKPQHLRAAMDVGIRAFVIGEALMRSSDRESALRGLREVHAWSE